VRGMTSRVKFQGLISSTTNSYGVMAVGIIPGTDATVTSVHKTMTRGKFLEERQENARSIVIGEKLAKALKVDAGEKVVLMAQASDGSMGAEAFRIKGIFRSSNPDLDRSVVYIPLRSAQNILAYGNNVSEVALLLDHSDRAEAVQAGIKKVLPKELEVLNWRELSPDLVAMMDMFDLDVIIVMVIIYVLVGVGILNTLLMAIMERVPEFGVLNAVGMKPSSMVQLILLEAFFLGCIGIFFGTLLGLADVAFLSRHGIDFSSFSAGLGRFLGMQTTIYSLFSWKGTLAPMFFVMVAVMAAALYPARKAAKLQPMEAIRHL
jgi:putative ABC transport system permease protein